MEEKKDVNEQLSPLETEEETLQTVETVETVEMVESQEDLHGENLNDRVKVLSPGMMVAKRFFRSKLSVIGLIVLIALFLFAFVGPLFSPWGEKEVDDNPANILITAETAERKFEINGERFVAYEIPLTDDRTINQFGEITWEHWLGTDDNGYDIFTRLMLGGRISLTIGFVVVILETVLGVILGGLAGYFGGLVDGIIMRIVDILSCIPTIPIMLILSAFFDSLEKVEIILTGIQKLYLMMFFLTLIGWTGIARLVRGQILSLREQEFMLAAKCSGISVGRKIFKHLLPNVLPQLIVSMTLGLGSIILTEATLGFLGLGVDLGDATWGAMIQYASAGEKYLSTYINFWVPAGICITLAILAFNFVGDGLRDAFDPKAKR